jgi:hypothetical protein
MREDERMRGDERRGEERREEIPIDQKACN